MTKEERFFATIGVTVVLIAVLTAQMWLGAIFNWVFP